MSSAPFSKINTQRGEATYLWVHSSQLAMYLC